MWRVFMLKKVSLLADQSYCSHQTGERTMAMKNERRYSHCIGVLGCLLLWATSAFAKLPAPDSFIYGSLLTSGDTKAGAAVTLKLSGAVDAIVANDVKHDPQTGDYYLLRIPMAAFAPRHAETALAGETADIFVNHLLAATVTIGEPGSIQLIDLNVELNDAENSSMPTAAAASEDAAVFNAGSTGEKATEAPENTHSTNVQLMDSDGDGFADTYEHLSMTDPRDESSMPVVHVHAANDTGIEDGSANAPYNTIQEGIDAAQAYYTVQVSAGTYLETLAIHKNIRLVGESPSTTIIDAQGQAHGIYCDGGAGPESWITGFRIRNAHVGIECVDGASPLIRNNILSQLTTAGILCHGASAARIINNTIAENPLAVAIESDSSQVTIINNIISGNWAGIDSEGAGGRIDYNNQWQNTIGGDYVGTTLPGPHDTFHNPLFVSTAAGDFHLQHGSACLNAGDPMEHLTADYREGHTLSVAMATNIVPGDRIWITDGANLESSLVSSISPGIIKIQDPLAHSYRVLNKAYIFTDTSGTDREPPDHNRCIDMGAYGNTPEALPHAN
jgi:hypothetical protein